MDGYPDWGWGTPDSEQALSYVKRFGSVTVLNGHIHQTMQKVEGNVRVPYRHVDGLSATGARHRPRAGPMKYRTKNCAACWASARLLSFSKGTALLLLTSH